MSVAFTLTEEAGPGPLTFPGFPGVWSQGEAIEAQVFVDARVFHSVGEMQERVRELGVPLEETSVAKGAAPLPARDNHVPNAEEAIAAGEKALADLTIAELDERGADLDGYPKSQNKADKVAFLEDAMLVEDVQEIGVEATEAAAGEEG